MADCCCSDNVLLFACSGGSNVGQIANDAAKALDGLHQGRFYCLIGVGAGLQSFIDATNEATARVVVDGCSVACARQALANAGISPDVYVVVTDLGIEKGHHFEYGTDEVARVAGAAADALRARASDQAGEPV